MSLTLSGLWQVKVSSPGQGLNGYSDSSMKYSGLYLVVHVCTSGGSTMA